MPRSQPSTSSESRRLIAGTIGRHVLADMYGVAPALLEDGDTLCASLCTALRAAGFRILDTSTHQFPGRHAGATAVVLLTESHAAVHTYPEHQYLALDIFSCGPHDPEQVIELLQQTWKPHHTILARHSRPLGPDN